jgi:hypothetical protein
VQGRLLLNVVIRESAAILELLAGEDQTLLVRRNALLILDLALDIINGVGGFHFQSDRLAGQGLDEDLHTTTETEHQVQGRLLLNVVVGKGAAILQLLTSENETLLVRGDALLILDLRLHIIDGIGRLHLQGDGLASQGLDEDLHTTTQTQDEMESGLLLDVVVGEGAAVLELLACEDQTLLVRRNTLLVLDLRLDVVDSIGRFDLKSDGLASEGLNDCVSVSRCSYLTDRLGWRKWGKSIYLQICMPPRRRRTRWRVDSFWML